MADEATALRDAMHEYFAQRATATRQRLRELFWRGRVSLAIGLAALAILMLAGDLIEEALPGRRIGELLRESLLIGGWVAMWRRLEVFLYDWWPVRAQMQLYRRLSKAPVRIEYAGEGKSQAWRKDWPAAPISERVATGERSSSTTTQSVRTRTLTRAPSCPRRCSFRLLHGNFLCGPPKPRVCVCVLPTYDKESSGEDHDFAIHLVSRLVLLHGSRCMRR
jgi:hypothetical protein